MTRRTFLHVGMPKTGTTYLQDICWSHRDALRAEGLLLPGTGHREHLWAALDVQQSTERLARRNPRAPGTFERLRGEIAARSEPDALLTHEFFCLASRKQAARVVEALAPDEVHVVVTARDTAGMLRAGWQERVKNGSTATLRDTADASRTGSEFSWGTWDLAGIVRRWAPAVPPERFHVLPVPSRDEPADQHWRNFASVLGVEGTYDASQEAANSSLGLVEVELLRRVNAHLADFLGEQDRGRWIRGYLAEGHLRDDGGAPFVLDDDLLDDCRERSERAVAVIRRKGLHVVGDLDRLLVPPSAGQGRGVDTVSDTELLGAATELVARMLADVRRLTDGAESEGGDDGGDGGEASGRRGALRGVVSRLRGSRS
ncbi:hypothetical protein [uncultured Nocardioides sp.]|uniref:hypothetical protein n=1 Tax=uncultured Nocardioides sp. TaxID=198441 RepID=UPI00261693FB|nr:hypothetical protein [uncultured Nocardioides sp.]